MKKTILLRNLFKIVDELPDDIDERILKLDKLNLVKGRSEQDVTIASFNGDIKKASRMACLVAYKSDWDDPDAPMTVLKFRYDLKELSKYLDILKRFPIFEEYNNDKEYDWIRDFT